MIFRKILLIVFAAASAFAALFFMLDFFAKAAPAAASGQERVAARAEDAVLQDRPTRDPDKDLKFVAYFTDYESIEISDLSGAIVGVGEHFGRVKCNNDTCNQRTTLSLDGVEYEYKYSTGQTIDPAERRVIVQGTGIVTTDTIGGGNPRARFSFTATFEDNLDGTVTTRYDSSRPDASFIVPAELARFEINQ